MTFVVYSLESCPRCDEIKTKLGIEGYEYEERDMSSAESQTDLKMMGCFAIEAPIVEYEGECYEYTECCADGFFSSLLKLKPSNKVTIPQIDGRMVRE